MVECCGGANTVKITLCVRSGCSVATRSSPLLPYSCPAAALVPAATHGTALVSDLALILKSRPFPCLLRLHPLCSIRGEAEKRRLLLEQLDHAGQQQLMRGRVRWWRGSAHLPCPPAVHSRQCMPWRLSRSAPASGLTPPSLPAAPCCTARCGRRRKASWAVGGTATEALRGSTSPGAAAAAVRSAETMLRRWLRARVCVCCGRLVCNVLVTHICTTGMPAVRRVLAVQVVVFINRGRASGRRELSTREMTHW